MRRQIVSIVVGIVISGILLWIALRNTNISEVGLVLTHGNMIFLLPLLGAYYLQLRIKAWRWTYLIAPVCSVKENQVFPAIMVGAMGGLIFPAYLSELARTYILCRQLKLKYTSVLVTIIIERLFDFVTVLAFLGLLLLISINVPADFAAMGYFIGTIIISLVLLIISYVIWPGTFQKWILILTRRMPTRLRSSILVQMNSATNGLQSIKQPYLLFTVLALSIFQWLMMGLCTYSAILAFDISVPFQAALAVLVLTVAGMSFPSAPGFVGTIQVCFTLGLKPYGISAEMALAASVLFHVALYFSTLLLGIFYLRRIGYTIGALRCALKNDPDVTSRSLRA